MTPIEVELGNYELIFTVDEADEYTMHVFMWNEIDSEYMEVVDSPMDMTIMGCVVTQEDFDILQASNADPITLGAEIGISYDSSDVTDLESEVSTFLQLDKLVNSLCGAINISLNSPHPFVTFDEDTSTVWLEPGAGVLPDVYNSAVMTFSIEYYPDFIFDAPIEATVESCVVEVLGFKKPLTIDYEVGTGPREETLPKLK